MTPAEQSKLAAQAGAETGEVFPGDTPWRRRFVELVLAKANDEMFRLSLSMSEDESRAMLEAESLREALSYYAESANWRREVRNIGPRKAWKKPAVASDRGVMARLVLMTTEGTKCD